MAEIQGFDEIEGILKTKEGAPVDRNFFRFYLRSGQLIRREFITFFERPKIRFFL